MSTPPLDMLPSIDNWNGPADSASLTGAPIPSTYHWSPIQNMVPQKAIANVKSFINVAHTQLTTMDHTSSALKRKIAICIGVSRAVATAHYQVSNEDFLVPSETAPSMLSLGGDSENMIEVLVNPITKACYEMDNITNFSDTENMVITTLISATLGTVPLQGHSLLICGHHYLNAPDRQPGRAFALVERQFFRKGIMASWFEPDADILRDILWHKACHPINLRIKYETATNEKTKQMLSRVGFGSACWLPSMEDGFRAVGSYLKLFQVVDPIWAKFGGGIDYSLLELMLDTIKRFVPGVEDHVELNPRDERIPMTVVNRRSSILWADEVINRTAPKAAFAFGFYEAMLKHKVYLDGSLDHQTSLRYLYSLVKLKKPECQWSSYLMGMKYLEDTTRQGSITAVTYVVE